MVDGPAPIINLQGLNDPNSPIGRMLMSQDEGTASWGNGVDGKGSHQACNGQDWTGPDA